MTVQLEKPGLGPAVDEDRRVALRARGSGVGLSTVLCRADAPNDTLRARGIGNGLTLSVCPLLH